MFPERKVEALDVCMSRNERELFDAEELKYLLEVAKADPVFSAAGGMGDAAGLSSRISLENHAVDDDQVKPRAREYWQAALGSAVQRYSSRS